MDTMILEFEKNDIELRDALALAFGDRLTLVETKSFDGGTANVIQAILPVVAALTPILVAYFAHPKSPRPTRRVVVTDKGGVTIEGYTTEEVERLLERARTKVRE